LSLEVPFGLLGAALLAAAGLFAARGIPAWIPPALLVRVGVASPFTGMTRSFVALASGNLRRAFLFHPLGPPLFGLCAGAAVVAIVSWVRGRRLDFLERHLRRRSVWLVAGVVISIVWIRQILVFG